MWAIPDRMKEMVEKKGGQLREGASCAWVPSPTAATLHAMHYHLTDVARVQAAIGAAPPRALLSDILTPPLMGAGEMEGATATRGTQRGGGKQHGSEGKTR